MTLLDLTIVAIRREAAGIHTFELRLASGGPLPVFSAGAHIDLHLANGLIRSYSLAGPPSQRDRYVIGVNRDRASRGGSACMHDYVRVGDVLTVGVPRNNFPLAEDAAHSVLIAGGIGITPLRAMLFRLQELGRSWELVYCARSRAHAAFLDELLALGEHTGNAVRCNFDAEAGARRLDLPALMATLAEGSHVYCCGPVSMLEAFEKAAAQIAPQRVHVEYFAARQPPACDGLFNVRLAKTGKTLAILPGQTILDAVLDAGVRVSYSCMEGICGSCETRVVDGVPDHRDVVLSPERQRANDTMMICCSGAKSAELVLDL